MGIVYVVLNNCTPIKAFKTEGDAIDFIVEDIIKYNSSFTKEELYEEMSETGFIEPYGIWDIPLEEVQ